MGVCTQCNSRYSGPADRCPLDGAPIRDDVDPLIGRVIGGRYRVLGRMAEGGMASIYKARQDLLERVVAVKVLSRALSEDPLQKERFLREARAANRIHHECVIDVTDFGETEDGLVYLVMEYLEGESLADLVGRGPVPVHRAFGIVRQVCQGLQRAHDIGIFHRDLKPENIFLVRHDDGGDHAKILDFGLARVVGDKRLTSTGQVFGTPEYISPEQASGGDVTHLADLYALGVILYEMIAGRLPFTGSTARLVYQHLREQARPPSHVAPAIQPGVDAVVMRLLDKTPSKRYGSARAVAEALAALEAEIAKQDGVATMPAREVTTAEVLALPPSVVEQFGSKLDRFRGIAAARPADRAFAEAVARFAGRVGRLEKEYERVRTAASALREHVTHGRTTIERLRRALDELCRDEGRGKREMESIRAALAHARAGLEADMRDFARSREELRRLDPDPAAPADSDLATAYERAGRRAGQWRESVAEVDELDRDIAVKSNEMEDVRFQIGQFRGRLAALEVEAARPTTAEAEAAERQRRLNDAHRQFIAALEETARGAREIERMEWVGG